MSDTMIEVEFDTLEFDPESTIKIKLKEGIKNNPDANRRAIDAAVDEIRKHIEKHYHVALLSVEEQNALLKSRLATLDKLSSPEV
jgi:ribosomal protein L31E